MKLSDLNFPARDAGGARKLLPSVGSNGTGAAAADAEAATAAGRSREQQAEMDLAAAALIPIPRAAAPAVAFSQVASMSEPIQLPPGGARRRRLLRRLLLPLPSRGVGPAVDGGGSDDDAPGLAGDGRGGARRGLSQQGWSSNRRVDLTAAPPEYKSSIDSMLPRAAGAAAGEGVTLSAVRRAADDG